MQIMFDNVAIYASKNVINDTIISKKHSARCRRESGRFDGQPKVTTLDAIQSNGVIRGIDYVPFPE